MQNKKKCMLRFILMIQKRYVNYTEKRKFIRSTNVHIICKNLNKKTKNLGVEPIRRNLCKLHYEKLLIKTQDSYTKRPI